jgi:hypothetical protein
MSTTATATAATQMPSMMAMEGMASVFSASTRVTLLFTGWKTTSDAAYFGTMVFLVVLAVLNRFLTALKQQLEKRWSRLDERSRLDAAALPHKHHAADDSAARKHNHKRSRAKSLQYGDTAVSNAQDTEPLSPPPYGAESLETHRRPQEDGSGPLYPLWVPGEPWSWKRNGLRSIMEVMRTFTGYIL